MVAHVIMMAINMRWALVPSTWVVDAQTCEKTVSFLSFPYVCPEPVLVK
jgi:hypothetical protein